MSDMIPSPAILAVSLLMASRPDIQVEDAVSVVQTILEKTAHAFPPTRIFRLGEPAQDTPTIAGKTAA